MLSDQDQALLTVTLSHAIAQWLTEAEGEYPEFTADLMANAAIAVFCGIHNTQFCTEQDAKFWQDKTT